MSYSEGIVKLTTYASSEGIAVTGTVIAIF